MFAILTLPTPRPKIGFVTIFRLCPPATIRTPDRPLRKQKDIQVFCVENKKNTYLCSLKTFKMARTIVLQDILKGSDYRQTQFDLFQIADFEKRIIGKTDKNGKDIPYIQCLVRKK